MNIDLIKCPRCASRIRLLSVDSESDIPADKSADISYPKFDDKKITSYECYLCHKEIHKKREKSVKIRLYHFELEELNRRKVGNELAVWMRETCLGEKYSKRNAVIDVDPKLLRQMSGMGNNLNQIARLANAEGMSALNSIEIISVLNDIKAELEGIKKQHKNVS
jgi:DNA-directed RNA polymerase subunit RPC12/RpoP